MKSLVLIGFASSLAAQIYPGAGAIDEAIESAIARNMMPGAVVQIGKPGEVLYRRAYGARALVPSRAPMTEDTIFDAASLTKVVATTSSIMRLWEDGKIDLEAPVTDYLPEFQGGRSPITVRQLLTHFSGLRPDVDLEPAWAGYDTGIKLALADKPQNRAGDKFTYSDINFVLLGEIVHRITGKLVSEFAKETVFTPLGMKDTSFQPPAEWRSRIAPTEQEKGMAAPLLGVVHDPTTRFMGGVAGHAGMFTTAADLGKFADMILNEGTYPAGRLFKAETIRRFTKSNSPPSSKIQRGLGWDIDSPYSALRGEFPMGSFGHTGFTGTSLWMDPSSRTYVILLANSVHPIRRPPINAIRARISTIASLTTGSNLPDIIRPGRNLDRVASTKTGIDVLAQTGFDSLKGKRVGLITNHTGLSRDGKRNVDLMVAAGVNVVALISPEHGFGGKEDVEFVAHSKDPKTGIGIYSAYQGKLQRPSPELLKRTDVIVFDIQDIGARFYTYMCTLLATMQEAAKLGIPVMVLDRPNPITGQYVEGPILEETFSSFVGCYPLPLRHGMTLGEIAAMANAEKKWGAKLDVVKMQDWRRSDWFDSTGLMWVSPSPSMRTLHAAILYPGVAMLEYSKNYSVGRGTEAPFEQVGAPWINGRQLAEYLNRQEIPGVRFYPTTFQPAGPPLKGETVEGVRLLVTDRDSFSTTRLGLEIAAALIKLFPGKLNTEVSAKLIANRRVLEALNGGTTARDILRSQEPDLARFREVRQKYLLY